MASPEFELISRHFTRPTSEAVLGVGDDCALLQVRDGQELAVSTDTLVEGVHFFADVDPARLGHKALAVNLSDLAAMGASPRWFTLALTLPAIDDVWLAEFARGLFALADQAGIRLVGGDTTRGPLSLTLTVMGEVPPGQALRRAGAHAGDEVWVSGMLGDAALALAALLHKVQLDDADRQSVIDRLELPTPRVDLGLGLRGVATAAIDISDGLLADLGHLAASSGLAANIREADVPVSAALASIGDSKLRRKCIFAGGDDYELCFTAPATAATKIRALAESLQLSVFRIGTMRRGAGVQVFAANGALLSLSHAGFDHFAGPENERA